MVTAVFLGWAIVSQVAIPHQPLTDSRRLTIEGPRGSAFRNQLIMRPRPGGGWRRERSACEGVRHEVCQVDLVSRP
jgi:hypothetical protein